MIRLFRLALCTLITSAASPSPGNAPPPALPVSQMGQLNVSYASQIGTGHPGVFGEQDSPQIYTFVPSMMAQGFTLERLGADTYNFVPVTTLLGYKNNVNNVANVSNWGFGYLYKIQYYEANPAGKAMKFMVTIAYVPIWLGYDGTVHSVPRDWGVWVDIVTKICVWLKAYKSVYYIEIWNEPLGEFLSITGSPYLNKTAAYMDLYYYTAMGVRAAGLAVRIGGPAGANALGDTLQLAQALLNNATLSTHLDFFSYHTYDGDDGQDAYDDAQYLALAHSHGRPDIEVFVTEWNYSYLDPNNPLNSVSTDAISYVGRRLTAFLASGAAGAAIFQMMLPPDNSVTDLDGLFANLTFTPKVQTFRLMSVILGLGMGESAIMQSSFTNGSLTAAVAAVNNASQAVICLTNEGVNPTNLSLSLAGLLPSRIYSIGVWEASASNPTQAMRDSFLLNTDGNGALSTSHITVGQKSVVGVILHPVSNPLQPPSPSPPPSPPRVPTPPSPPTMSLPPAFPALGEAGATPVLGSERQQPSSTMLTPPPPRHASAQRPPPTVVAPVSSISPPQPCQPGSVYQASGPCIPPSPQAPPAVSYPPASSPTSESVQNQSHPAPHVVSPPSATLAPPDTQPVKPPSSGCMHNCSWRSSTHLLLATCVALHVLCHIM